MVRDKGLIKAVTKELKAGTGVTQAVANAVEGYVAMLEKLGGYMAERSTDLHDIRDRAISVLRDLPAPGVPELSTPSIIVARDLAPAETATLKPDMALGIVTEAGGPTSHTAILAAQLGIPAVVKASGILEVSSGETIALDGGVGEVVLAPSDDDVALLSERSRRRSAALASSSGEGSTRDGHKVALLANIGTADDASRAAAFDLEGSGLFRTEFLFLDRGEAPSVEEQTEVYQKVFEAFGDRRVVVRTLDVGADKPLAFAKMGDEENPALGQRGLRLNFSREDILDDQLTALAEAYRATGADVRVMAPMVATVEEAEWFARKVRALGLPKVGIMIEVPAAAINSATLLSIVDFASIGTNDLSQYTMAADRMQGELSQLLDPWQPAVLKMIRFACQGGAATGKPIGVCGEAGGGSSPRPSHAARSSLERRHARGKCARGKCARWQCSRWQRTDGRTCGINPREVHPNPVCSKPARPIAAASASVRSVGVRSAEACTAEADRWGMAEGLDQSGSHEIRRADVPRTSALLLSPNFQSRPFDPNLQPKLSAQTCQSSQLYLDR